MAIQPYSYTGGNTAQPAPTKTGGLQPFDYSTQPQQPKKSLLTKVSDTAKSVTDFLGLGNTTNTIANDVAHITATPRTKALLPAPTGEQNIGAALQLASLAVPAAGAERIGASLAEGALAKAALGGAGAGAQYGALSGAGQAMGESKAASDKEIALETLKQGGIGALGGAVLGAGGTLLGKGLAKILGKSTEIPKEIPLTETPPVPTPKKTPQNLYSEPYISTDQLPVIPAGKSGTKTASELPSIQLNPKEVPATQPELPPTRVANPTSREKKIANNAFPEDKLITKKIPKSAVEASQKLPSSPELTFHPIEPTKVPTTPQNAPETALTPERTNTSSETIPRPKTSNGRVVAKAASDINQTLVKQGFDNLPAEEQAKYSPQSYKESADKVASLMDSDIEKVKSMAAGKTPVPKDVNSQILFNAIEAHATQTGDGELLQQLAKSPYATKLSEAGQTMGGHGYNDNPFSPVKAISDVQKTREANIGTTVAKAKKEIISREEPRLKSEISKSSPKKEDWNSFLESITC